MTNLIEAQYLSIFWLIGLAYTATIMTPGPDFACIMRNTLTNSKRAGVFAALGVTLGMCFHLSYAIPGAVWLNSKPTLMLFAKVGGGLYLCYLGWKSLRTKKNQTPVSTIEAKKNPPLPRRKALKSGFFTNALNPMVMVFFVGLFTTQIDQSMPLSTLSFLGLEIVLIALTWFLLVVFFFSQPAMQNLFARLGHWVERFTGAVLIALGFRVAIQILL